LAGADVQWHGDLGGVPLDDGGGPLLVVANELFDALPVRQFERQADGWHECLVGAAPDGAGLAWTRTPGPVAAAGLLPPALADAAPGTLAEICPAALSLATTLAERVVASGAAALIVDFGRAAGGPGATLQAVRRHRAQDVLDAPGSADLAAHVDFAGLAAAAQAAGAQVYGPVPQGDFLKRLGIATRAAALAAKATPAQRRDIEAALHRLIDPGEMGTLFQVLALCHPQAPVPAGFAD
jgi:NADH dehydrogenase [ubiquinone] 1 alpha subcomplex assembly factor 7